MQKAIQTIQMNIDFTDIVNKHRLTPRMTHMRDKRWISWLLILTAIGGIVCDHEVDKDPQTECKADSIPVLSGDSGSLIINSTVPLVDKTSCQWTINGTGKTSPFFYLDIEELILGDNDTLEVLDSAKTPLYTHSGPLGPGAILVAGGKDLQLSVRLNISSNSLTRRWDVGYGVNSPSVQLSNIDGTGRYQLYFNPDADFGPISPNIILKTKYDSKKLLMNVEALDVGAGGTVTFELVEKYNNTWPTKDTTAPDFLLSTQQQINVKINNLKVNKAKQIKGLLIHYELVDKCSQYKQLTELDGDSMENIVLPLESDLKLLSSFRCLNIFEHKTAEAKLLLDLSKFSFTNAGDLITALDGNTRYSPALAVIEPHFLDIYWNTLYLYSSANKMWIMFESPQVVNTTIKPDNKLGVRSLSQGGSFFIPKTKDRTDLILTDKTKSRPPIVFTYYTDLGNQLVLDFNETLLLPGNANDSVVRVYEDMSRTAKPLLDLRGGSYPPDLVASNTNQLKVEFGLLFNFGAIKSDNILNSQSGCHATAKGDTSAYSLTACAGMCSWFIPERSNSTGVYIIQFSHLYLPKDTDSVRIARFGSANPNTIFEIKGPYKTNVFPEVILPANGMYTLYTKRTTCDKTSVDSSELFGVSMVYVDKNINTQSITLTKSANASIQTLNYPNAYSVGSDQKWDVKQTVNETTMAFVTITDLQLTPGHQLMFVAKDVNITFNSDAKLADIGDSLLPLPFFANLNTQLVNVNNTPITGRGFRADIWPLTTCGGVVTVDPNAGGKAVTPEKLDGVSQCVWIVKTTDPKDKSFNLIEFTLNHTKDFDFNKLKIYDSNTIRDDHRLHFEYFATRQNTSSSNTLIIVLNVTDPKKDIIGFDFTQTVCNGTRLCDNKKRCLLDEFYCNGIDDCGDWTDEMHCNGTQPQPSPSPLPPEKIYVHSGVNGWVVTLVICPLFLALGVAGTVYGPRLMGRFGRGRYREFQDFSEVS